MATYAQTQSVNTKPVKTTFVDVSVNFSDAGFDYPPIITATTIINPTYAPGTYNDVFTVSVYGVSTSGFTARVFRSDSQAGWDMPVSIGFIAMSAG